nr:MAG TPA: tail tube protein [Caudoviricetes sp.]DAG43254.1 MAG TPA: tail tube protein [Bacteriophage sp.]
MAATKTAGVSSLGVTFSYGVETTKGTKPTAFTILSRINQIGDVTVETEAIDASALEDKQTRNIPGRDTVSDTFTITVNKTDETIAEWEKVITDYQALTEGKRMWFQTITPGFTKAEFVVAAPPSKLPISGKEQNSLLTMEINLTVDEMIGSDTKVEPTSGE